MRNGYTIDVISNVDIQKIVSIRGKVIVIYERVSFGEKF